MVMVTGIMGGAAIAAITTVGTEAAGIIMDGTSGDIADGTNRITMHQSRLEGGAALIIASSSVSVRLALSITVCCREIGRGSTCGCGQAAKCSIATFGAFEDFLGDVPTNPVFLSHD
jgi:hypothetical protein